MTHVLSDPFWLFQALSAVFYVILGAWVLTLSPQRRQTTLLGVFAILFGLIFLVFDVSELLGYFPDSGTLVAWAIAALLTVGAFGALLGLAWVVPPPEEDRQLLWTALGAGLGLTLVPAIPNVLWAGSNPVVLEVAHGPAVWVMQATIATQVVLQSAMLILVALRAHPHRGCEPSQVTQFALLAVAAAATDAFRQGTGLVHGAAWLETSGHMGPFIATLASTAWWLVPAGLWGWNMLLADDEMVGIHRTAMLSILGLLAAGALYEAALPELQGTTLGVGLARTLGVGLLAYGILRHDLAGLDAKVRFGISKTTVAGIFIAVFFVVSEGAQELFAGFAGSEWLGILAAGALLFALAPIQRAADRIAEKAVPTTDQPRSGGDPTRRASLYRSTVQRFLADGEISGEEEQELADLAEEMGIGAGEAMRIRREVEDEAGGGEPA